MSVKCAIYAATCNDLVLKLNVKQERSFYVQIRSLKSGKSTIKLFMQPKYHKDKISFLIYFFVYLFIYLFTYGLFKDAISKSDYTGSQEWMIRIINYRMCESGRGLI
jgi:hypothetical protein